MKDTEIIALYEARNEAAITATSEKYGPYCYSIAYNILNSHEDSEECTNDTWLKVWNMIPPHRPRRFLLFLGKITRNLSIDRWRKLNAKKRQNCEFSIVIDEIAVCIPDKNSSVEEEILEKELIENMNIFLTRLKRKERNIFLGRYFYFRTTKELANEYQMKESNVLLILSRTRKKLKEFLEVEI